MNKSAYLLRDFTADLLLTGRLWRKMTRQVTAQFGIAEAGAAPMIWIGRLGEGVRQNALAERCGIEGASLVRVIDELANTGFVTREPDPTDRRANALYLTDKGREIFQQMEGELSALRARVFAEIDDADIATAQRVFNAIKDAARRLPGEAVELDD
ncbi:MAG TPA: MarR family transcriptional regulator [Arsenicitalea sp.]|jgi:MarR family transcriptional regulator for hemolysin|nr:MarR family transcriptional regulator [Arsenicitalea sp.]